MLKKSASGSSARRAGLARQDQRGPVSDVQAIEVLLY